MKPNSRILTLADLVRVGACSQARERFAELFGESVNVTAELAERYASDFDFGFAARAFLSAPALAEYERIRAAALAEYKRVTAPAFAEYERIRVAALAEYRRNCDMALAEYERICDTALAEYKRICNTALAEYERICARAFAELCIQEAL
ncbi:MAG: hypothetical protein KAY22_05565 [Rhizorhabdus sp.]|uniref:hypothetical protein n=1 Tax=Rhizorhabdus sp. TaxID=1968843 RepID=UPI001B3F5CBC|nr:hypothetical protein [Rhizorhabdus sp.]MBP8231753.1 hypothetical protein [Rhizorhabdus sp.]